MRITTLAILFLISENSIGQDKQISFYEIIKGDSVVMSFNPRDGFIEKKCADYFRYVRIDNNGNFNGKFVDVSYNGAIIGVGTYIHGKREGNFEVYYSNGKVQCQGIYENNKPTGVWNFFHQSGLPERSLRIDNGDTLLIRLIDSSGKILVNDGTGTFIGPVASNEVSITKGKVVNGKPDGWWNGFWASDRLSRVEKFAKGKLVKGSSTIDRRDRNYKSHPKLNNFFYCDYFGLLEKFKVEKCTEMRKELRKRLGL
ncbi:MAG TPA: hypothetical protein DGG95_12330 [Cytophagales bacterium]|jgi:antitoxin component YwqK of YwqJK toxin-antitoxin module|nr:hypothetical protein [Cytophagales bacterium]